jgi:hypothetical protein
MCKYFIFLFIKQKEKKRKLIQTNSKDDLSELRIGI